MNSMPLDPDTFRSVLGRFATGVTVLTTRHRDNQDHGMTVSSFCSLSLNPPLVAMCIDERAEMHDLLAAGRQVVVNVLSAHQEMLSRRFAEFEGTQRFDGIGFSRTMRGIPILDDVLAWLECEIVTRYDGGDHGLYVASVERATARDGMRPLLHYRGGYAQLER
jgi:flavin reductase (DIM6/NTAB) family NADH-FMN oxidoreductase RutF